MSQGRVWPGPMETKMNRKSFLMMASALVIGAAATGVAVAQPGPNGGRGPMMGGGGAPVYDPAQLPEFKGKVAQYSLTPRGDVDGLILADGTEVHFPPFMSTQIVFTVKPGDNVTIHGVKARALPMVAARSITNDATGAKVLVMGMRDIRGEGPTLEAEGKIAAAMHTPRGDVDGVRLEDGTIVRLPPGEAKKLAEMLAPGKSIVVRGDGYAGPLGKAVVAMQIGPDKEHLTTVARPRPGDGPGHRFREMREMRHGFHPHGMDDRSGPQPG